MVEDIDKMYCGAIRRGDVLECEIEKGKEGKVVALQDDVLSQSLPTVICAVIELYDKSGEALVNEVVLEKKDIGAE